MTITNHQACHCSSQQFWQWQKKELLLSQELQQQSRCTLLWIAACLLVASWSLVIGHCRCSCCCHCYSCCHWQLLSLLLLLFAVALALVVTIAVGAVMVWIIVVLVIAAITRIKHGGTQLRWLHFHACPSEAIPWSIEKSSLKHHDSSVVNFSARLCTFIKQQHQVICHKDIMAHMHLHPHITKLNHRPAFSRQMS